MFGSELVANITGQEVFEYSRNRCWPGVYGRRAAKPSAFQAFLPRFVASE